ncbi:MAG: TetR/AcrR family transcriptional regulator [Fidelibacterota bacterium]|nr:MAG: TetR/AcrR family transcriptional regulator [Candidatus Neomarinimicrobiota bacterium]
MTPRHKDTKRTQIMTETRQLLMDAAIQEFAQYGYENANINRISTSAGFAKGTIYNYFPSKRALMLALIEETAQLHLDFIAERVRREQDAGRRMERFFEAGFDFVATYLTQGRVMINSLYGPDPEFRQVMYQAYLPMFELVGRDIIGLGISQGTFRPVDPTTTAGLLMNIYLGIASQTDDTGKTWQSADQVADFVLNGLRKPATSV